MKKLNLMSQVKLTGAITLLACLFFLAGAANSAMIYDNLGSTYGGYDSLTWGSPLFDSFSAGPTNTTLLDVQLRLRGSSPSGSFSVALYSDSNTSPGTLLRTIGTLSDSALPSTWSVVDFPLASPYPLAANTRYWLELNSTDGSTAQWSWSPDQGALGVTGEYFGNYFEGITYVNQNDIIFNGEQWGPYQMRVITPLPGAVWLLGSGLACLGLWRGRKLFQG